MARREQRTVKTVSKKLSKSVNSPRLESLRNLGDAKRYGYDLLGKNEVKNNPNKSRIIILRNTYRILWNWESSNKISKYNVNVVCRTPNIIG
jgi:hypothetical protein